MTVLETGRDRLASQPRQLQRQPATVAHAWGNRMQRILRLVLIAAALLALSQSARGGLVQSSPDQEAINAPRAQGPGSVAVPDGGSGVSRPDASAVLPGVVPLFTGQNATAPTASDVPVNGHLDAQHVQNLNRLRQAAGLCRRDTRTTDPQAAQSAWVLGLLHLHGKGAAMDKLSAHEAFDAAWRCGFPLASAGLAWCAMEGCGKPMSVDAALQWTDRLLRSNPGRSLYLRWLLYQRLSPLTVRRGLSTAHLNGFLLDARPQQWLIQAAALGDAQASNELGIEAFEAERFSDAISYFSAAAAVSDAARFNLGVTQARQQWLALSVASSLAGSAAGFSSGVPSDVSSGGTSGVPAASTSVSRAADALRLARRYHRGEGIPANFPEAIRYYKLAAEGGSLDARRMLNLIYARLLPDGRIDVEWMSQLARLPAGGSTGEPLRYLQRDASPLYDFVPLFWRR